MFVVLVILVMCSKYTRALTFEIFHYFCFGEAALAGAGDAAEAGNRRDT